MSTLTDMLAESDHPVLSLREQSRLRTIKDGFRQNIDSPHRRGIQYQDARQVDHVLQTALHILGNSEDHSAPSHIDAEGNLTQICFLQNSRESFERPHPEAEGNLSPDCLSNAREKIFAEAGYKLAVATGQYYITPPGVTTSDQAPT